MNHYEQAALIFYNENNHLLASNLFVRALEVEPNNSMLWYGLGDSFCYISTKSDEKRLYSVGLSCVKKSFEIDPTNRYSQSMLERMKANPSVGEEFITQLEVLTFQQIQKFRTEITAKRLVDNYLDIEDIDIRIKLIMHLGETKDSAFYSLLEYCILNETNQNVRFAVLKRIHFFKNENLRSLFEKIISSNQVEQNEPYYSMALGRINQDWSTKLIDNEETTQTSQRKVFSREEISESLRDDRLGMTITSCLFMENIEDIKKLFENRDSEKLASKIKKALNDSAIKDLKSKNIFENEVELSDLGLAHIAIFLKQAEVISKTEKTKAPSSDSKESIIQKNVLTKKPWWKIW